MDLELPNVGISGRKFELGAISVTEGALEALMDVPGGGVPGHW